MNEQALICYAGSSHITVGNRHSSMLTVTFDW